MTLRSIIDQASTLALELPTGLDTEVKVWNMGRESIEPAGIAKTSSLSVGADETKTKAIAYFKIKP